MMIRDWRPCCPYPEGQVVEHRGAWWRSTRRTGRGEEPGNSGAWAVMVPDAIAEQAVAAADPRQGGPL